MAPLVDAATVTTTPASPVLEIRSAVQRVINAHLAACPVRIEWRPTQDCFDWVIRPTSLLAALWLPDKRLAAPVNL